MCMDTSNLFKKNSDIGDMLTRSALSDRSILTEMFKYFSISDLQYFLKNRFVFHSNRNFLISKFLSIRFVIHFNVQYYNCVKILIQIQNLPKRRPSHTCYICVAFLHCVFSNVSSNWLHLHICTVTLVAFFIGPRYTWGPIYGSQVSLTH